MNPWDPFFLDPVVFDIWFMARNAEKIAKLVTDDPTVFVESDAEMVLESDPELADVLSTARRSLVFPSTKKESNSSTPDNKSVSIS